MRDFRTDGTRYPGKRRLSGALVWICIPLLPLLYAGSAPEGRRGRPVEAREREKVEAREQRPPGRESRQVSAERTTQETRRVDSGRFESVRTTDGNLPKSWQRFDPALHEPFQERLEEFRGDRDLKVDFQGGEGAIFTASHRSTALKRWYQPRRADMAKSIEMLERARVEVERDAKLSADLEVVRVHERGADWIQRDFHRDSVELRDASQAGRRARERLLTELNARQAAGELSPSLGEIHKKLGRDSANLHWSESKQKVIVIDMM